MEKTTLEAVISEMGRLAIQVGEQVNLFVPEDLEKVISPCLAFAQVKRRWLEEFYPPATS